jgi:CRP-like cAMP-binding protein
MHTHGVPYLDYLSDASSPIHNWLTYIESYPPVFYKKGDVIIKASTPATHALFLEEGMVKTIKENANGRTVILEISSQKCFIGLLCLLSGTENDYTSIALTKTKVRFLPAPQFDGILKTQPGLHEEMLKNTFQKAKKNINRLITINNKQLPGRVADVILYFYELNNQSEQFEFPMSREELAQFAGTTKESFIRTLTEFKHDKIIIIDGKSITINSMEIVKTLSRLG